MPHGPWLLVIGMHRSGTSAVTGALGHLGLAVPGAQDRWEPSDDNPDHWESRALGLFCDVLLARQGGTWDRPPDPDVAWSGDPGLGIAEVGDPAVPARRAFPDDGPAVWKDPRACLLLPYWLAHLPKPVAAVFIWRSPVSVARSLQARDRMHLADGVALWERYNRQGLAGLLGVDTFVTRYESIVEDPAGRLEEIAAWLRSLPQFAEHAEGWDLTAAARSISSQLLRQRPSSDEAEFLLDEQRLLVEHLVSIEGPHRPLASPLPGTESVWSAAVLGDRHQLATLSRQRDALKQKLADQRAEVQVLTGEIQVLRGEVERLSNTLAWVSDDLEATRAELADAYLLHDQMRNSASWRLTRPLRQVSTLRSRSDPASR